MKKVFTLLLLSITLQIAFSQGNVGVGTATPDSSAILDVSSTSKGMLMPRMTTAQRDLIASPAVGLQILNLDDYCVDLFDGNEWIKNCGVQVLSNDTISMQWRRRKDFPGLSRAGQVGFSIGSKGYVGTGYHNPNPGYLNDFWEFDPNHNTWTQKANFGGSSRYNAVGFSIDSKGYVGTGVNNTGFKKDFWEYDPDLNTWTSRDSLDVGRSSAVGFNIGNKGYIGTGSNDDTQYLNDFYEFNPDSNSWIQKANWLPRNNAVAFSIGNKGYVGTGYHNIGGESDFWEFDPVLDTFLQLPDFGGGGRANAVAFAIGSKGYVGTGNELFEFLRDFWMFVPDSNDWIQLPQLPANERVGAVGFAIGNRGYIGLGSNNVSFADMWEFIPETIAPVLQSTLSETQHHTIRDNIWTRTLDSVFVEPSVQIGIGSPHPKNFLDVQTNANRTGQHAEGRPMYVTGDVGEDYNGIEFRHSNGTAGIGIGYSSIYATGSNPDQDLGLKARGVNGLLKFVTHDAMRMLIQGNGNVAIGLDTSKNKLDISTAIRSGEHPTGRPLYVTGNLEANSNGVEFRHWNGTQGIGIGYNTIYATGSDVNQDLGFMTKGSGKLKFTLGATERMIILNNGHVGLGIANPNGQLQLSNGDNYRKVVIKEIQNNENQYFGFGTFANELAYQIGASNGAHVFYAGQTATSSKELMRITGAGDVGIGETSPNELLEIGGDGRAFFGDGGGVTRKGLLIDGIENNAARIEAFNYTNNTGLNLIINTSGQGKVGIGTPTPTEKLHVDGNGLFTGTVTATCGTLICSDMRYKIKASPLSNSLQKVLSLNGIYYYWDKEHFPEKNFTDDRQVGVSAQELETVLPELVHTGADGYKTVDYSRLTPVLIEAVKEQQRQIEDLQQQVKMLVELITASASAK